MEEITMAEHVGKTPHPIHRDPQNVEEAIRTRAYQLYEERGRESGHELDDWVRAEEEVTQRKIRTTAA